MKLKRITLVNWSLYEPIDIDVEGSIAFVGENGAGKSSLLDAIQIVLFGGNQTKISLNSATSGNKIRNDRSIKAYCQGAFKPIDSDTTDYSKVRLRDDTYSYIALSFEHPTKGFTNIFVGIEARASERGVAFPILGVMSAPRSISKTDFMQESEEGSYRTFEPSMVMQRLQLFKDNSKEVVNIEVGKNAGQFVELVARVLSPSSLSHKIEPSRLETILAKSVRLKSLDNVSSFVRDFILNPNPIETSRIRSQQKHYDQLYALIESISKQIEKLQKLSNQSKRTIKQHSQAVSYHWIALEKQNDDLCAEEEELDGKLKAKQTEYDTKSEALEKSRDEEARLAKEIQKTDIEIEKDDAKQTLEKLKDKRKQSTKDKVDLESSETDLVTLARKVKAEDYEILNLSRVREAATAIELAMDDLHKIEGADPHIATLIEVMPDVEAELEAVKTPAYTSKASHEKTYQTYQKLINNPSKFSPVKRSTQELIDLLANNGIQATPVCHLAQITNLEWQPAIEALIGGDSEALIVSLEDEELAYHVYRQALRTKVISRAKIVKSSRTQSLNITEVIGTAAEFVESENELALKFLQYRLQRYKRVETELELKQERFALTKDGMLSNDITVTGLQLSFEKKFTQDPETNLAQWRLLAKQAKHDLDECNKTIIKANNISSIMTILKNAKDKNDILSFRVYRESIDKCVEDLGFIEGQIIELDLQYVKTLEARKLALEEEKKPHDEIIRSYPKETGSLEKEIEQTQGSLGENQTHQTAISSKQTLLSQEFFFDPELNDSLQSQEVDASYQQAWGSYQDAHEKSIRQFTEFQSDFSTLLTQAKQEEEFYPIIWNFELEGNHQLKELKALIDEQANALKSSDLVMHEGKADKARKDIVQMFRTDIVGNLQGKFQEMNDQIQLINTMLKDKVLHNQRYQLGVKPEAAYVNLVKYIKKASKEDLEAVDTLFDAIPEDVMETINLMVETDTGSDYRYYFSYEFILTDVSTGETSNLSGTLGSGSGGEKQTPLYIAMSSALSSAWRSDKGTDGAALALFDEAFKDLDSYNLQSAISFMQDVGLQMIYAAPDDKELNFRDAGISTIIYLTKDVNVIDVDVDVPNKKGESFSKQNPNANKELMQRIVDVELEKVHEAS